MAKHEWILEGHNGVVKIWVSSVNPVEFTEHRDEAYVFNLRQDAERKLMGSLREYASRFVAVIR